MKPKQLPPLEELQARRLDLLNLCAQVKTTYMRDFLHRKLDSVQRDLFTLTKNPIYK